MKKRIKVSDEWTLFKFGDIDISEVGSIAIYNLAGRNLPVKPTEEEQAKYDKQIIRIRIKGDKKGLGLLVRPGRFQFFEPESAAQLAMKCDLETCPGLLSVFPR